jgi:hypothetical protein
MDFIVVLLKRGFGCLAETGFQLDSLEEPQSLVVVLHCMTDTL